VSLRSRGGLIAAFGQMFQQRLHTSAPVEGLSATARFAYETTGNATETKGLLPCRAGGQEIPDPANATV